MSTNMNIANNFEIQNQATYTIVRFFGFVDAGIIEHIGAAISEKVPETCTNIIIDLEKVEFLDSHGVGFFVSLLKRVHRNKGQLVFMGAKEQPASVLNMVGFDGPRIAHCENMQQADALMQKMKKKTTL